jgi:hypothetical protein
MYPGKQNPEIEMHTKHARLQPQILPQKNHKENQNSTSSKQFRVAESEGKIHGKLQNKDLPLYPSCLLSGPHSSTP